MFERFNTTELAKRESKNRSGGADRHYLTAVALDAAVRVDRDAPFDDHPTAGGVDR